MPFKTTPPLYYSWKHMFRNCRVNKYYNGISVCKEWEDYGQYEKWCFENGWSLGKRVARKDKKLDFTPSNCLVVSVAKANDMRSCVHRLDDGRTTRDLCKQLLENDVWIDSCKVMKRIFKYGWTIDKAFSDLK